MGVGPNFILDKGMLATGTGAYRRGQIVQQVAGTNDGQAVIKATPTLITSNPLAPLFVCMEDIDAAKVATGKAYIDTRLMGIARVIAGAAIPANSRITVDANSFAVPATRTATGTQPVAVAGFVYKTLASVVAGSTEIEMQLVPGLMW